MAKEKLEIDWNKLDTMLMFKASKRLCSTELGVSHDTLERRIKEKTGQTWTEYADEKLDGTRLKLQSKAIKMAFDGNVTLMIFCLKNLSKWSDRVETTHSAGDGGKLIIDFGDDKKE